MEFNNKLYPLRRQKGLSQEEPANRLNVSRQTVSKWEVGDSTPDMEKLIAISDLFEISLDELVLDKKPETVVVPAEKQNTVNEIAEKVFTSENKKAKRGLKIAAIVFGAILAFDFLTAVICFCINVFPE